MAMTNATARAMGRAQSAWSRLPVSADHRGILGATVLIGGFTFGIKLVSLVRDTVVASRLGMSDANDAYITAWLIPGFLSALLASSLVAGLLPVMVEARTKRGDQAARRAYAEVMLISVVALVALMAALYLSGPWLLAHYVPGYGPEKLALTNTLMRIMLPAVGLTGVVTIWTGMLNVENRFGFGAAAPVAIPITTALAFILIPHAGAQTLATAFVAGAAIQFALLYVELQRRGIGTPLGWHGGLPETRQTFRLFWPALANDAVFGGLGVVDQAMAATLGHGSNSVLSYGTRLVLPFLGITSAALGTSLFPHFARLVAHDDWEGLRRTVRAYSKLVLAATIPISLGIIVTSTFVVRLLFERGQFTADDTRAVAHVQAIYAIVIPIECLAVMFFRLVLSIRANHLLFYGSLGIFIFNVTADYALKHLFGVDGIVIATVMNQGISLCFLVWLWRRQWNRRFAA